MYSQFEYNKLLKCPTGLILTLNLNLSMKQNLNLHYCSLYNGVFSCSNALKSILGKLGHCITFMR